MSTLHAAGAAGQHAQKENPAGGRGAHSFDGEFSDSITDLALLEARARKYGIALLRTEHGEFDVMRWGWVRRLADADAAADFLREQIGGAA